MRTARRLRIVLVDDHRVVREGLKAMLQPEFEVVGETGLGEEAAGLVAEKGPDVVLLDARLPDRTGPDVCRALLEAYPDLKVIILSTFTDEELVTAAVKAGAMGYVVKDIEDFGLKQTIREVSQGRSVLSSQVAGKVMERLRGGIGSGADAALNRSQIAILRLIVKGYSNKEIAKAIHLSENTVKTHLQAIFGKLGVRNRVEAAMTASRRNFI
jgi:two-component system, NarL family, response regulator DevR